MEYKCDEVTENREENFPILGDNNVSSGFIELVRLVEDEEDQGFVGKTTSSSGQATKG